MKLPKKKRIGAALLALLILASGATAYTVIFTAGSGTTYETGSGLVISTNTDHGLEASNPFNDSETVYIDGVTFSATGSSSLAVDQFRGSITSLSAIDTSSTTIDIDPDDKAAIKLSGSVTAVDFADTALDGTSQITYSASGSGNITVTGLPASTNFAAATTTGEVLTTGTTTASGEASITVDAATNEQIVLLEPSAAQLSNQSPDGTETNNENVGLSFNLSDADYATDAGDSVDVDLYVDGSVVTSWSGITSNQTLSHTATGLTDGQHNWHVETTDNYGTTSTSATATFTVNHYAPTLTNASPANGSGLTNRDQSFTIDVNDTDFLEPSGDTVNASLYIDGSYVGSDTLTANGTASVATTLSDGGTHDYYWEVQDEYGLSATSSTISVSSPSTLYLRQETDPDTLVTDATANITAYFDGTVTRRNTSDGSIDLSGFPIGQPLTIRVQADGYYTRTVIIESIYEQSNVFLLNDTVATHQVRYQLQDVTGAYADADTVLFVERDLKLNGSVEWRTITGDNFGVVGVPTNLVRDERYRLRVKNLETGNTVIIGKYTAIQSETVTVSPGSSTIDISTSESDYAWDISEDESAPAIIFEYLDTADQTDGIKLTVHERYNKSNVLINNQTFTSNDLVFQYNMTQDQANKTWMAEIYVDRGNGTMHFREPIISGPTSIIPADLDQVWQSGISVFVLLVAGMAFSVLHVGVGAIATSLIGGMLWYLGLLSGIATGPAIALAITVSVMYHYYAGGGF